MDLHSLISSSSYLAIFLLMVSNGIINLPSSQLLYLIAGYFISSESLLFVPTIIAGAFGNTIGNIIIFLLIKKYDKPLARKILMMDENTFNKVHSALHTTFSNKGMWWIFFGKIIPSVKAFIPIVAGLANTKNILTSFVFLFSSTIWATMITSLGYFFGENVKLSYLGFISLLIGGTIIFIIYKNISKKLNAS